mgnify:CR=1 FL=1
MIPRRAKAAVSADGGMITLTTGLWSQSFPAADLPRITSLYEGLRDRRHPRYGDGAFAATYQPVVTALARAAKVVEALR